MTAHFTIDERALAAALAGEGDTATVRDAITGVTLTIDKGLRANKKRAAPMESGRRLARALAGGRVSADSGESGLMLGLGAIMSPANYESDWRSMDLDNETLGQMSPEDLALMLADVSPEMSQGIWQFLRLANPGWEMRALWPGREREHRPGQALLDAFKARINGLYGSLDVPLNRLFLAAYVRGAFCAELVLDAQGREAIDLVTPDPASMRFRPISDPARGRVWQLGQWQGGKWVALDRETIQYVPVDPWPGKPYGRPPAQAGVFAAIFMLGLLHDLRRVVSQQGYPRLDLTVDFERLAQTAPDDATPGNQKFATWVQDVMDEINTVYGSLEPDDAYVHSDVISVGRPVGTTGGDMAGIDALMAALERMAARGLKMMPLLLGINDATTETNANRQWELMAAAVKSLQHLAESMLERLLTVMLEAAGVSAEVEFRFAELRGAERLRDAQAEKLEIDNARELYEAGFVSQDEAAQRVIGRAADEPAPRVGRRPAGATVSAESGMGSTGVQGDMRLTQGVNGHGG